MTGAMTALTSNMLLGQGPWTVWQMSAWGMMGLSSGLLQRLLKRHGLLLSLYGCVWGFLFGWFMNLWTVSGGFFGPFSLRAVVAACAASLPLDLAHAPVICCFSFVRKAVFAENGTDCRKIWA